MAAMKNTLSRRSFISHAVLASGSAVFSSCRRVPLSRFLLPSAGTDAPVDASVPEIAARAYFGPDPMRAHATLLAGAPTEPSTWTKHAGPVIIGGGLSGLTAAFYLKDSNPLLLEAGTHFGGNSQGQIWHGIPYSIGAAYLINPEEGDEIHSLLSALDLLPRMSLSTSEDQYALNGAIHHGLWKGGKNVYGRQAARVDSLRERMLAMLDDSEQAPYPDIPTNDPKRRAYVNQLDRISFYDYLKDHFSGEIPEPLFTALEQYCWSSMGGSTREMSAAAALNFYVSEFGEVGVFDSGNSRVTQTLYEHVLLRCGRDALRSGTTVTQVETTSSAVRIIARDIDGRTYGIEAPCAIMCCQKFVAKHIVKNLRADQLGAFNKIRYRSYLTAAVMIRGPQKLPFYDLYLLKQRSGNPYPAQAPLEELGATDAIVANWSHYSGGDLALLLYRALPYDGARAQLFDPSSYDRARAAFEKQINDELLPLFSIRASDVADIRITRWGHALPLAETGLIAAGVPELLTRPIQNRIFFANQDNWALPAFETSVIESTRVARQVIDELKKL